MQTIFYASARFETDDAVAVAVMDYAEALARENSCAAVRLPTVHQGTSAISRLLIGAGFSVAIQSEVVDDGPDLYDIEVDAFEVQRTLHEISERMSVLRRKVAARSFSTATTIDEIWELGFDEIDVIGEPD